MHRLLALATVAASLALAGCLGSAAGPGIPQSVLAERAWEELGEPGTQTLYGAVEVQTRAYTPQENSQLARVLVISVTDVPILDEEQFLPDAIARIEAQQGVEFVPAGTESGTLPNEGGEAVEIQLYDVDGAPIPTMAAVLTLDCDDPGVFVAVAAYGALSEGVAGEFLDEDHFADAKTVAKSVTCRTT